MSEPLNPPIVTSSTFRFDDTAQTLRALAGEGHLYSRWDNPTVQAVEARLAALTGAERALAFGSGMGAIAATLLCALTADDRPRLLCQRPVYGGTHELVRDLLPRLGVEVAFFSIPRGEAEWAQALQGRATCVFAETPTNPTLQVIDLRRLAAAAHGLGATLVVDNTFATPLNQRPLALGADVEVHSATKYLGGHHDLLAGVVAGGGEFVARLWTFRKLLGGVLDAFPAYLLHRGLKTLEVRVARQNATAAALAAWLREQPQVTRVHYPGLDDHPDRDVIAAQMTGGGGMLSFEVASYEAAIRLADALQTVVRAPSLGGTESLVTIPRTTSHTALSPEERARAGIGEGLVRLSIGLEPLDLLQADLARGLAASGSTP